jgi:hypothetical protein
LFQNNKFTFEYTTVIFIPKTTVILLFLTHPNIPKWSRPGLKEWEWDQRKWDRHFTQICQYWIMNHSSYKARNTEHACAIIYHVLPVTTGSYLSEHASQRYWTVGIERCTSHVLLERLEICRIHGTSNMWLLHSEQS